MVGALTSFDPVNLICTLGDQRGVQICGKGGHAVNVGRN